MQCNHLNPDAAGSTGGVTPSAYGVAISGPAAGAIVGTDGDGVDDVAKRHVFGSAGTAMVLVNANAANGIAGNWIGLDAKGRPAGSDTGVRLTGYESVGDDHQVVRANRRAAAGAATLLTLALLARGSSRR